MLAYLSRGPVVVLSLSLPLSFYDEVSSAIRGALPPHAPATKTQSYNKQYEYLKNLCKQ